jgi:hypothetical protein
MLFLPTKEEDEEYASYCSRGVDRPLDAQLSSLSLLQRKQTVFVTSGYLGRNCVVIEAYRARDAIRSFSTRIQCLAARVQSFAARITESTVLCKLGPVIIVTFALVRK